MAEQAGERASAERRRDDAVVFGMYMYSEQCDALRDLIEVALASAVSLDSSEVRTADLRAVMTTLPETELAALRAVLQRNVDRGVDAEPRQFLKELMASFDDDTPWAEAVMHTALELVTRSQRSPLLAQSLIISAVGALDALVGNIVAAYLRARPELLEDLPRDQEREFSLGELRKLSSLEDVEEVALGRRVDAVLFSGLNGWRRFFSNRVNVDLANVIGEWSALEEVFERRHVAVHHAGRASRRYVRFVERSGMPSVRVGEWLPCTHEYLRTATDRLQAAGIVMSLEAWRSLHTSDLDASSTSRLVAELGHISDRSLRRGGFQVAASIAQWLRKKMPDCVGDELAVREFLAKKRQDGLVSELRATITSWKPIAPEPKFELARLVLLEEADAACDLLVELASRHEISPYELVASPVVRELGDDPRIDEARVRLARRE